MMELTRVLLLLAPAIVVAACAASPSPTDPSPSSRVRVSGTVVSNPSGRAVAGATVTLDGRSTMTGEDGVFTFLGLVPQASARITVSAGGHLDRLLSVSLRESRDLAVDLISSAPPFDLNVYREMARDGFEQPGALKPLTIWSRAPRFFLRTVHDDTGEPIPGDVLAGVRRLIEESVPELTGGRFRPTVSEGLVPPSGADARGLVVVHFVLAVSSGPQFAGQATVGEGNPGNVWLRFNRAGSSAGAGCPEVVRTMHHEIVHTMGFWHTSAGASASGASPFDVFGSACSGLRHPAARLHAAVAYSRAPGNRDVDEDPGTLLQVAADGDGGGRVVACEGR